MAGLAAHPECDTAYTAQHVADRRTDGFFVRTEPFDRARLREGNYIIDLNVFAHRRTLVARLGGFDEDLIVRAGGDRGPRAPRRVRRP